MRSIGLLLLLQTGLWSRMMRLWSRMNRSQRMHILFAMMDSKDRSRHIMRSQWVTSTDRLHTIQTACTRYKNLAAIRKDPIRESLSP